VHVPHPATAETQNERMKRGVAAVQVYLKTQFPEHIIEVLKEGSDDIARRVRTFNIRRNGQRFLLRVADEVLDLTDDAIVYLRKFQTARTLREAGADRVVLVTTTEVRVEPI
jgi:hypothetical protein